MLRRREKRNAARLPELQGALHIAREENLFKTHCGRMMALDNLMRPL